MNKYHRYNNSPKGQARNKRYRESAKYKLTRHLYQQSINRKTADKRYATSPRGRIRTKRYRSKPAVQEHNKWRDLSRKRAIRIHSVRI